MLANDKGISQADAEFYPKEQIILHDNNAVSYERAWRLVRSDEYFKAVYEYNMFKLYGLPKSGGWKEQNIIWIIMVSAVDRAVKQIEKSMLEKIKE